MKIQLTDMVTKREISLNSRFIKKCRILKVVMVNSETINTIAITHGCNVIVANLNWNQTDIIYRYESLNKKAEPFKI